MTTWGELVARGRGPGRLVDDLEFDPVGVVEERGVIALDIVWELLRRAFDLDALLENPLPAPIDGIARRCLERDVVNAYGIPVIRHGVRIGLLLSQPEPRVRSLQIPDLLAALSFEFKYATPAQTSEKTGIERFAPLDIGDD